MGILPRVDAYGVVYLIRNTASGGVYVGQTIQDYRIRWRRHRDNLTRGVHENPHLQRSWNKHGAAVFVVDVAEAVADQDSLNIAEQRWIVDLRARGVRVYNLKDGGSPFGGSPSEETRRRIGESSRGRKASAETCQRIADATRGVPKTRTPALEAKWEAQRGKRETPEQTAKRLAGMARNRPIVVFRAPDGALHETQNITDLAQRHGLHPRLLHYVASGKQHHHRGWVLVEKKGGSA